MRSDTFEVAPRYALLGHSGYWTPELGEDRSWAREGQDLEDDGPLGVPGYVEGLLALLGMTREGAVREPEPVGFDGGVDDPAGGNHEQRPDPDCDDHDGARLDRRLRRRDGSSGVAVPLPCTQGVLRSRPGLGAVADVYHRPDVAVTLRQATSSGLSDLVIRKVPVSKLGAQASELFLTRSGRSDRHFATLMGVLPSPASRSTNGREDCCDTNGEQREPDEHDKDFWSRASHSHQPDDHNYPTDEDGSHPKDC